MGVPTHRIEIRKDKSGHNWSNDYLVEAPTMADAVAMAIGAVAFERSFHQAAVNFAYYMVSDVTPGERIFRHVPLNVPGLAGAGGTDYLPLFNTLRLDMATDDSDPARKYYRLPLGEGLVTNEVIDAGTRATIEANWDVWFATWPEGTRVVTTVGHIVFSAACYPNVQMRQLRRHRRPVVV